MALCEKGAAPTDSNRIAFDFRLATGKRPFKKLTFALRDLGWQISFLTD